MSVVSEDLAGRLVGHMSRASADAIPASLMIPKFSTSLGGDADLWLKAADARVLCPFYLFNRLQEHACSTGAPSGTVRRLSKKGC